MQRLAATATAFPMTTYEQSNFEQIATAIGIARVTQYKNLFEAAALWYRLGQRRLKRSKHNAYIFWQWLVDPARKDVFRALGFRKASKGVTIAGVTGELRPVEVHSVRPARRSGPEGGRYEVFIELTQAFWPDDDPGARFRGGCTVVVDFAPKRIRYIVRKRLEGPDGVEKQRTQLGLAMTANAASRRGNYYGTGAQQRALRSSPRTAEQAGNGGANLAGTDHNDFFHACSGSLTKTDSLDSVGEFM